MLHPAIRVLCLCAAAAQLPALPLAVLLVASVLLLILHRSSRLWRDLWRLRWMLLAILILYAGFTPGDALWPALPGISRDGLLEGTRRAMVLVLVLQLVILLMETTPLPQLCAGLLLLARPFAFFGLPAAAFARRLALALGEVTRAQEAVALARRGAATNLFVGAAELVMQIERSDIADAALEIPALRSPPWWQWLLPLALLMVLWMIAR